MQENKNRVPRGFRALVGERLWAALLGSGVAQHHRPGAHLLHQGERGDHLFALTNGRVKVLAGDIEGSRLLPSLRAAGDLVGEMAARPDSHRSANVQALDHCMSRCLTRADFDRFLRDHNADGLFRDYLVAKLSETVPYQLQQVHLPPRHRVARLILETMSLADPDDGNRVTIPFSQEALATALGLARSTVADQISALRACGALGQGPRLVVANDRILATEARVVTR